MKGQNGKRNIKRSLSLVLCALLVSTGFAFFGGNMITDVSAEIVEGEGNCFAITNSTYLNVTMCSSVVVNVTLESIPKVISITIRTGTSDQSTEITMGGFVADKTYYRHQDGHLIESFVADGNGNYSYTQDLSEPHHVFIQEEASTKYIKDDLTGGDCTTIGTWDSAEKICTLDRDVYETIVIANDGITLEGSNLYSVIKGIGSYGIYASGRSNIIISNITVEDFSYGIYLYSSNYNTIINNTVNTTYSSGIYLQYSHYNKLTGNSVASEVWNYPAIYLFYSSSSIVTNNTAEGGLGGIYLDNSGGSTLKGNIARKRTLGCSGQTPRAGIYLLSSGSSTVSDNLAETGFGASGGVCKGIQVSESPDTTIDNNTAIGRASLGSTGGAYGDGIVVSHSANSLISDNTAIGIGGWGGFGIITRYSPSLIIVRNDIEASSVGMDLGYSEDTTIVQNTVYSWGRGIFASNSPSLIVRENDAESRASEAILLSSGTEGSIIVDNTVSVITGGVGIHGIGGDTIIERNIVSVGGPGSGIAAGSGWNIIHNNTVTVTSPSNAQGILVQGYRDTIQDNVIQVSAGHGIVSSSATWVLRNDIVVIYGHGISAGGSSNKIIDNDISATGYGITLTNTCCSTVSRNQIRGANVGIAVYWWASRHDILENVISDGRIGLELDGNIWAYKYDFLIRGNLFARNKYGMMMHYMMKDFDIYYNCFLENQRQLYKNPWRWYNINWDDGAGKGNWWSDYSPGMKLPHQGVDWYPTLEKMCAGNAPPNILSFTATTSEEGSATMFSVDAIDPEGQELTYSYDFDSDGVIDHVTTSNTATYVWGDDHTGTATVSVSDGELSVEATTEVSVTNTNPQVVVTVDEVVEGSPLDVTFNILDSGSDDIFAVLNWGDEATDEREYLLGDVPDPDESTDVNPRDITDTLTHTFGDDTILEGTLTVTDDDNGIQVVLFTIVVVNGEPEVTTYTLESGYEGDTIGFTATATDPGADDLDFTWNWDDGSSECNTYLNTDSIFPFTATDSGTHVWGDNADYEVTLTVTDDDDGYDEITMTALIANLPPEASLLLDGESYDEGSPATATSSFSDPGTDDVTLSWTWIGGPSQETTFYNDGTNPDPPKSPDGLRPITGSDSMAHTYADDGTFGVILEACDDDDGCTEVSLPVFVNNVAPTVTITGPASGYLTPVNTPVTFSGSFTDPGILDTHIAQWLIDDTPIEGNVTEIPGSGTVEDEIIFTEPGIYQITLMVADDDGGVGSANTIGDLTAFIVVYDPEGGFVTGGGWIQSPLGAYRPDPSLTGKASFGFVSKYHKGATVPSGQTEFQFRVADLNFHSGEYEWLVVSGPNAQFKGTGTINGEGEYKFMIWAIDGDLPGSGDADKFRIKIWQETGDGNEEDVVYDNEIETLLGGGQIKIHKE